MSPVNDFDTKDVLASAYASVVYIEVDTGSGWGWSGSGVIVDAEKGYILTAYHVIDGLDYGSVTIELHDGRTFTSKEFYGSDEIDAAIIVLEPNDVNKLPACDIGDSDKVEIGDDVIAIGCPFRLKYSVTRGIISHTIREILQLSSKNMFQTDTPMGPGSSGGGLFNRDGELIALTTGGINSDGMGFCVPVKFCKILIQMYELELKLSRMK
jgi:S1-C subfamily serine protease